MNKQVGDFHLNISDPWPIWLTIRGPGPRQELRFSHEQLADLEYLIASARREIERRLVTPQEEKP